MSNWKKTFVLGLIVGAVTGVVSVVFLNDMHKYSTTSRFFWTAGISFVVGLLAYGLVFLFVGKDGIKKFYGGK